MSLNVQKLEKVRRLAGGIVQARCPACAEGGQDRQGEHLRVYPDGKYGCCVHPKDREHRKRIFALAGVRERQEIRVHVAVKPAERVQPGILGRLGRVFQSPIAVTKIPDASDGVGEVQPRSAGIEPPKADVRTARTGLSNSNGGSAEEGLLPLEESRTLRTGVSNPYAYAEESPIYNIVSTPKEFAGGVRSVREPEPAAAEAPVSEKLPYITAGGDLVIPFDSPERYHYWRGGQSVAETRREAQARLAIKKG
jgi:hypothetical protein